MSTESQSLRPTIGLIEDQVHRMPMRVYYEDTDASGIVYYANYLKFIERARTDLLRILDITHSETMAEEGVAFAVRRCEIDYLAPARLDDELEIESRFVAVRGASLDAVQTVKRDGDDIAVAMLQIACIDSAGRPHRLPTPVREALTKMVPVISPARRN